MLRRMVKPKRTSQRRIERDHPRVPTLRKSIDPRVRRLRVRKRRRKRKRVLERKVQRLEIKRKRRRKRRKTISTKTHVNL